jgi:prepilin-type N-terminal cleavage/methylation domain-containing protein
MNKKVYLRGFTLVEVLVASILMSIIATGLAFVFLAGKSNVLHVRSRIQAAELGRYFLTSLGNEVRQDQWGINCLQGGSCPDGSAPASNQIGNITFYNYPTVTLGFPIANLQKVKLRINWTEPAS